MKGLIALRQSTDAFRLKSLQDIKERVHLITVPGQMVLKKKTWSSATKSLLQTEISMQSLSMRMIRPANSTWELPLLT